MTRRKLSILTGISFAALALLSAAFRNILHIDSPIPWLDKAVDAMLVPLQRLEDLIWPNQWTFYTPHTTVVGRTAPEWMIAATHWLWLLAAPFAIGFYLAKIVQSAFRRKSV